MALQEGFIKTLVDATRDWVKDYVEEHGGGGGGSNIEIVNLTLATEDGAGSVSGIDVTVNVEGENTPRYLTTNAQGKVSFNVNQGLQYTISFVGIEGYRELANITYRASLTTRNITATYIKDGSYNMEHVILTLNYYGGDGTRATAVQVKVGSTTNSYSLTSNATQFDVPLGSSFEVIFPAVNSYTTPSSRTYTAASKNRSLYASYIGVVDALTWVKYDGTSVPFNDVTEDMESDLVGLRISNSTLIEAKSTFIVPMAYLLGDIKIGTKQWCASNVQFQCLPYITSAATALTVANSNGEANTAAVIKEAGEGSLTVTAGTAVPAFTAARAVKYTIKGTEIAGHIGSYTEMKAFSDNRTLINVLCRDRFGKDCITVNSGYWWTSTQYSASSAVILYNGGWDNGRKTSNGSVVPLLAY